MESKFKVGDAVRCYETRWGKCSKAYPPDDGGVLYGVVAISWGHSQYTVLIAASDNADLLGKRRFFVERELEHV